jgi:hypothetical protein
VTARARARNAMAATNAAGTSTISQILDGHVTLEVECLDRIYLNAYVPNLQVGGQVVGFLTEHLGNPIPSPALFGPIGERFRHAVARFATTNAIPVVRFEKDQRKAEVMRPYLEAAAHDGVSKVVAIGVAQEFQRVFCGYDRGRADGQPGPPRYAFEKADRRVSCYYFYLWDAEFGPGFIKLCSYFPWPAKVWVNGHEWAKQQARQHGIAFTELAGGFATCDQPEQLQAICDALGPRSSRRSSTAGWPTFRPRWGYRPGRRVLVGAVDAPDRGLPHPGAGPAPPGAGVLRGVGGRQPGHRPARRGLARL